MTFERLPHETDRAFEAFKTYLELGAQRSHDNVAHKLSKSGTLISRWASKYQWAERTKTYMTHCNLIRTEAEEGILREEAQLWASRSIALRKEEWKLAEQLIAKAEDMLAFPVSRKIVREKNDRGETITTVIEPTRWSMTDISRMIELGGKLRRLATGLATERSEISGVNGGPIKMAHLGIIAGLADDHLDQVLGDHYKAQA